MRWLSKAEARDRGFDEWGVVHGFSLRAPRYCDETFPLIGQAAAHAAEILSWGTDDRVSVVTVRWAQDGDECHPYAGDDAILLIGYDAVVYDDEEAA